YGDSCGIHPNYCSAHLVVEVPQGRRDDSDPLEGEMEAAAASATTAAPSGTLLGSISDFCRRTGMAESTFGRRAVNDGKFVARLPDGARVTPETLQRVNNFMQKHGMQGPGDSPPELLPLIRASAPAPLPMPRADASPEKNFRFFD